MPRSTRNILILTQRQRIPDVHHHRQANNLGRQVEITEGVFHQTRLTNGLFCLKPFALTPPFGSLNHIKADSGIPFLGS